MISSCHHKNYMSSTVVFQFLNAVERLSDENKTFQLKHANAISDVKKSIFDVIKNIDECMLEIDLLKISNRKPIITRRRSH